VNPQERLGSRGADEILNHPWFAGVNWEKILNKTIRPPFIPKLSCQEETKYIDEDFISEIIDDVSSVSSFSSSSSEEATGEYWHIEEYDFTASS
jgi:hypothetical protein